MTQLTSRIDALERHAPNPDAGLALAKADAERFCEECRTLQVPPVTAEEMAAGLAELKAELMDAARSLL